MALQPILTKPRTTSEDATHGASKARYYGPVEIQLGGFHKKIVEVACAEDSEFRKLGNDFLDFLIIAFDSDTKYVFVSH